MLRWAKELRRSVDYIWTRPDVDTTRLAFAGTSWGAALAGTFLAVEPRFRAAVLNVPGLIMAFRTRSGCRQLSPAHSHSCLDAERKV